MNKNDIPFGDYCRSQDKDLPEDECPWFYKIPNRSLGVSSPYCAYKKKIIPDERKICGILEGDPYKCPGCGRNELGCCCDDE